MTATLTKANTKIVVRPIEHYVGARLTRYTWRTEVVLKANEEEGTQCKHESGHRTVEAAKRCGIAMWKRL